MTSSIYSHLRAYLGIYLLFAARRFRFLEMRSSLVFTIIYAFGKLIYKNIESTKYFQEKRCLQERHKNSSISHEIRYISVPINSMPLWAKKTDRERIIANKSQALNHRERWQSRQYVENKKKFMLHRRRLTFDINNEVIMSFVSWQQVIPSMGCCSVIGTVWYRKKK